MTQIEAYHQYVYNTPWGKLFYELLWEQLASLKLPEKAKILDFGSGFGKTSHHLAQQYHLTAYEPNVEMLAQAQTGFRQISSDFKTALAGEKFDLILLHNVLEYVENPQELMETLQNFLTPTGGFSVVKHQKLGHVLASGVMEDNPQKALREYEESDFSSQSFGQMRLYTLADLKKWSGPAKGVEEIFGLRTLFGLSNHQEIKYTKKWQEEMLALERVLAKDPIFQQIAYFQHIILR